MLNLKKQNTPSTENNTSKPIAINESLEKIKKSSFVQKNIKSISQNELIQKITSRFQKVEWRHRVWFVVAITAFIVFFLAPYALLMHESQTLLAEAEKRGKNLTQLLAASNQAAMSQNKSVLYSVTPVMQELGVKSAWLTDLEGMIIAPVERFGKSLSKDEMFAKAQSCSMLKDGYNYNFACPIFKWVESQNGFRKQVLGYAYLQYSSEDTLNFLSHRGVELFKYLIWFLLIFTGIAFLITKSTKKDLDNLKFDIRSVNRGANSSFPVPENFQELQDIALEVQELHKNQMASSNSDNENQNTSTFDANEFFQNLSPLLSQYFLVIDEYKSVIFTSNEFENLFPNTQHTHILRAFKNVEYGDLIVKAFSQFVEKNESLLTEILPNQYEVKILKAELQNSSYYFLVFNKEDES